MTLLSSPPSTIFLIDDDQDDCLMFEVALKEINPKIKFSCVSSCLEILPQLHELAPDLIFLDIKMPLKNGFDCLKEIRKNGQCKAIPIVIYSSSIHPEDVKLSYDLGATLYFQKPSIYQEFIRSLESILSLAWHVPGAITAKQYRNGRHYPFEMEKSER
jgi:PleD family two-component response regulator